MISIDCSNCYTKVEFNQNIIPTNFNEIDSVLTENRDNIKMFSVDDYIFEFIEYVKENDTLYETDSTIYQIIGKYITPIPHLTYMLEEETQFKINLSSSDKFIFFFENEIIISMHGMLFINGEFRENLIYKFNISEIRNLTNDLVNYILKSYKEIEKPVNIWNAFKCIGIYNI